MKPFQNRKEKFAQKMAPRKTNKNSQNLMELASRTVNAFTIKKALADFDTGNFPLNAQLIPVAQLLNAKNIRLHLNFENRNTFDIELVTQLYKLVWIGITYNLMTTKK
jgi:hypothetical protein